MKAMTPSVPTPQTQLTPPLVSISLSTSQSRSTLSAEALGQISKSRGGNLRWHVILVAEQDLDDSDIDQPRRAPTGCPHAERWARSACPALCPGKGKRSSRVKRQ
jgi:hypothetical protein